MIKVQNNCSVLLKEEFLCRDPVVDHEAVAVFAEVALAAVRVEAEASEAAHTVEASTGEAGITDRISAVGITDLILAVDGTVLTTEGAALAVSRVL